ncbi:MAG: hypothetical protein MZV70_05775 [Desulfobacterales bacterium]|nr:hypothetical protein [Desulfobacterales bacterium]
MGSTVPGNGGHLQWSTDRRLPCAGPGGYTRPMIDGTERRCAPERPGSPAPGRACVLYWMQAAQRARENPALDYAACRGRPARPAPAPCSSSWPPTPDATASQYRCLLAGACRDCAATLRDAGRRVLVFGAAIPGRWRLALVPPGRHGRSATRRWPPDGIGMEPRLTSLPGSACPVIRGRRRIGACPWQPPAGSWNGPPSPCAGRSQDAVRDLRSPGASGPRCDAAAGTPGGLDLDDGRRRFAGR